MTNDIVTYLSFNGDCEAAFKFYEKVLNGRILAMMRYADAPPGGGPAPSAETSQRIMHARLKIGERYLMGGDAPPQYSSKPQGFSVSLMFDDPDEAERVFHALAEGGAVRMPIGETFWALRFGMLVDKFGTPWMVNCEKSAS